MADQPVKDSAFPDIGYVAVCYVKLSTVRRRAYSIFKTFHSPGSDSESSWWACEDQRQQSINSTKSHRRDLPGYLRHDAGAKDLYFTIMSMSTTSTATYILAKYSRAYPTSASSTQEIDAEWQHFTNPTVRLILDMKKSGNGELESYRVRILWSLNTGQDGMDIDQRDVLFVSHSFFLSEKILELALGRLRVALVLEHA